MRIPSQRDSQQLCWRESINVNQREAAPMAPSTAYISVIFAVHMLCIISIPYEFPLPSIPPAR